ncbi:MAG: aspartate/glutamate racemase family protein [Rhizobiaceae bacterium]|nr:aspartate/glutamate racemase family protein [Rhizobiaceae bacterium]
MRIALINPNTSSETTRMMLSIASEVAGTDAEVLGYTAGFGAPLITTPMALDRAVDAVAALAGDLDQADAVIVAAFGDPGLDSLRSKLSVPVTGIAEAAMAEAAHGGRRFAVVTTTPELRGRIAATAARQGHETFAGTWTTEGDAVTLTADAPALEASLANAIQRAVREGGAEAVVIGGGPLALAARTLAATFAAPLIEPVPAAVRLSLKRIRSDGNT